MAIFDGVKGWWRQANPNPHVELGAALDAALGRAETLRSSELRRRYAGSPIYRAMVLEAGSDPLSAVQLQGESTA